MMAAQLLSASCDVSMCLISCRVHLQSRDWSQRPNQLRQRWTMSILDCLQFHFFKKTVWMIKIISQSFGISSLPLHSNVLIWCNMVKDKSFYSVRCNSLRFKRSVWYGGSQYSNPMSSNLGWWQRRWTRSVSFLSFRENLISHRGLIYLVLFSFYMWRTARFNSRSTFILSLHAPIWTNYTTS